MEYFCGLMANEELYFRRTHIYGFRIAFAFVLSHSSSLHDLEGSRAAKHASAFLVPDVATSLYVRSEFLNTELR